MVQDPQVPVVSCMGPLQPLPWRYNWLNFLLAIADIWSKRNLCTVLMIQGRKLKNMRTRNIGIRMGISQENHCEMFPGRFQESSNSLLCFSN
jgi:hypothetical protein